MSEDVFGAFPQQAAIAGQFSRSYSLTLSWFPEYIDEFPKAVNGFPLQWKCCKFVKGGQINVPQEFGVYCFSVDVGSPLPSKIHLPLYIGKASDQYLQERYEDYLREINDVKGRKKVVQMLNKYKDKIVFWWVATPSLYVETIERHLQMCCEPPCNDRFPLREKFWGKAFELISEGEK